LRKLGTSTKAKASAWFFKTGKGQYGYGDQFRGVTVPEQHKVAKQYKDLRLSEIDKLLKSPWHEDRLTGVFILVQRFQRATSVEQKKLTKFYLQRTAAINNWDIVDSSAAVMVGNQPLSLLKQLATSKLLWDRRIAIIATYHSDDRHGTDDNVGADGLFAVAGAPVFPLYSAVTITTSAIR
jgi:hypothetical protein